MSPAAHAIVFGLLIVDLLVGAYAIELFWGHWPAIGFEFAIILGYVLFVLQWLPWRRPQ
jgi:hypothetical protein